MRAKSSKQRCPALFINDSSCLRLQGWWLFWRPSCQWSGSRSDFPGVDHEGRQACSVKSDMYASYKRLMNVVHIHILLISYIE